MPFKLYFQLHLIKSIIFGQSLIDKLYNGNIEFTYHVWKNVITWRFQNCKHFVSIIKKIKNYKLLNILPQIKSRIRLKPFHFAS